VHPQTVVLGNDYAFIVVIDADVSEFDFGDGPNFGINLLSF